MRKKNCRVDINTGIRYIYQIAYVPVPVYDRTIYIMGFYDTIRPTNRTRAVARVSEAKKHFSVLVKKIDDWMYDPFLVDVVPVHNCRFKGRKGG